MSSSEFGLRQKLNAASGEISSKREIRTFLRARSTHAGARESFRSPSLARRTQTSPFCFSTRFDGRKLFLYSSHRAKSRKLHSSCNFDLSLCLSKQKNRRNPKGSEIGETAITDDDGDGDNKGSNPFPSLKKVENIYSLSHPPKILLIRDLALPPPIGLECDSGKSRP